MTKVCHYSQLCVVRCHQNFFKKKFIETILSLFLNRRRNFFCIYIKEMFLVDSNLGCTKLHSCSLSEVQQREELVRWN